ncbi:MAG: SCO family protein [Alphaproteobacteria bacterium]|nr:SCO family protein [Alphaproteobacteria bacterium]
MKHHAIRLGILLGVGVAVGLAYTHKKTDIPSAGSPVAVTSGKVESKPEATDHTSSIGGPFSLLDQNGNTMTDKDFEGKYKLIFFGYTSCPMICPTALQKMTQVLDTLGPQGENIQPIFITVDPARDTVEALKDYIPQFHARMIGLTGTQEQIDAVMSEWHVYAKKAESPKMEGHEHMHMEMPEDDNYMMDHSTYMYLMGPENELVALYPDKDQAQAIVDDIKGRGL